LAETDFLKSYALKYLPQTLDFAPASDPDHDELRASLAEKMPGWAYAGND
jgi:hypothetical protein